MADVNPVLDMNSLNEVIQLQLGLMYLLLFYIQFMYDFFTIKYKASYFVKMLIFNLSQ